MPAYIDIEFGGVDLFRFKRQSHQRDAGLVVHTGFDNRSTGIDHVAYIVHVIEITVPGGTGASHELALKLQGLD